MWFAWENDKVENFRDFQICSDASSTPPNFPKPSSACLNADFSSFVAAETFQLLT